MTKREFLDTVFALVPNEANAIMDAFDEYVDSNEPHWIPCSERLPESKNQKYWICTDCGYQCEARWTDDRFGLGKGGCWGWYFLDYPQYTKVVAWMPLPEPYKGVTDGRD